MLTRLAQEPWEIKIGAVISSHSVDHFQESLSVSN